MDGSSSPPEKQFQNQRPTLRCPSCAFSVPLPAEICPNCRANLRTGQEPNVEEPASNKPKIVFGVLALLVIIGLAMFMFGGFKPEAAPARPVSPAQSTDDLGEAVNIFHDLPDQNLGVKPNLIIDRSKETSDKVNQKARDMDEILFSTE